MLLLGNVCKNFWNTCLAIYEFDCLFSLIRQKFELELLTNIDVILVENAMRGEMNVSCCTLICRN